MNEKDYFSKKKKQVLKYYNLWREWYKFFEDFRFEDEPVPPRPDELSWEELLENFGNLSDKECKVIQGMAQTQLAKYFER